MARLPHSRRRTLRHLAGAASRSVSARIRFQDTERADAERTVDVLGFSYDAGRWLVATWTRELSSLRLLDLDRIRSARATTRPCDPPPEGFDPDWFALGPLLGNGAATPIHLPDADQALPRAVLPAGRWASEGGPNRTWLVHSCRPDRVRALASSLGWDDAVESAPDASREGVAVASPEARILRLVSFILAQPEAVTAKAIFERFEKEYGKGDTDKARQAREKKFTRDKNAVKRLGFVLVKKEDEEAYLIDARSSALPPLELAPDEAVAVWTAALAALRHSNHPLRWDLESALRKLMAGWRGLPPRAVQGEELGADGGKPDGGQFLAKLTDAWLRRKRITIEYWSPKRNAVEPRQVDVYGWARRRGEWIFVGWCHKRSAVRIFYLSRVRALATPQPKGQPRGDERTEYEIPTDFDVRRWSRQQIWDYEVHEPKAAAVRFTGSLAPLARHLLPGAKATVDAEGRRTLRLEVRSLRGLVRQVLAWGPEAELIEPAEGREQAREMLRQARALAGGRP